MSDCEDFLAEDYGQGHGDESYNLRVEDEDILLADDNVLHQAGSGKELVPPRTPIKKDIVDGPVQSKIDITSKDATTKDGVDDHPEESGDTSSIGDISLSGNQFRGRKNFRNRRGRGIRGSGREGHRQDNFNNGPQFDGPRPMRGFANRRFQRHPFDRFPPRDFNFGPRGPHPEDFGPPEDFNHEQEDYGPRGAFRPNRPPRNFGPNGPPRGFGPNRSPRDHDNTRDFDNNGPPGDFGPNRPPRDFVPNKPGREFGSFRDFGPNGPPRDFGPNGPPRDFGPNGPPREFGPNGPPRDFRQGPLNDFGPNGPHRDFGPRGPPRDNRQSEPPRGPIPNGPQNFGSNGPRGIGPNGPPNNFNTSRPPLEQFRPLLNSGPPSHLGPLSSHLGPPPLGSQSGLPHGPPPGSMGHPIAPPVHSIPQRPLGPPSGPPPQLLVPPPVQLMPPPIMGQGQPPHVGPPLSFVGPPLNNPGLQMSGPHLGQPINPPHSMGPPAHQFRPVAPSILPGGNISANPGPVGPIIRPEFSGCPPVLSVPNNNPDSQVLTGNSSRPEEDKSLAPPGVSPERSDMMQSPEGSHTSPMKNPQPGGYANPALSAQPSELGPSGSVTTMPISQEPVGSFESKSEKKKVLINPHFKGPVNPPTDVLHGTYLAGADPYSAIGSQVQPGTISESELNRLADQFINEQRRCLEKAKYRQDEDFFQKTQKFIENISKDSSEKDSTRDSYRDRDRERDRDRDRDRERERERYYKQKELERLKRAQEQFIHENQSSMKRRRDSPGRGSSPKRQRTPENDQSVDPEEREYQTRLREQAEMRQRVLLAKERRRKRDAASKLQTQSNLPESEEGNVSPKTSDREAGRSMDSSNVSRQAGDPKSIDGSRRGNSGVEVGRRDAYSSKGDGKRDQQYYERKDDPYRDASYRDDRRDADYARGDTYRQEDSRQYRQDTSQYRSDDQTMYRNQSNYQQGYGDDPKNSAYRETYRSDERRDPSGYSKTDASYRQESTYYNRPDERSANYKNDERKEIAYRVDEKGGAVYSRAEERSNYDRRDNAYRSDDRKDPYAAGYRPDDKRDTAGYRPDERNISSNYNRSDDRYSAYRNDDRNAAYKDDKKESFRSDDRSGYRGEDRREGMTYRSDDKSGYRADDRRDLASYRGDERRTSPGYRAERDYSYRGDERKDQYPDDRSYRSDDKAYRQSDKRDQQQADYRSDDRKDYHQNYDRRDVPRAEDRQYEDTKRIEEGKSVQIALKSDEPAKKTKPDTVPAKKAEEPKSVPKTSVENSKPVEAPKPAPAKPVIEHKFNMVDPVKTEEDLLLQEHEPTLDEMLEDDTLRLSPAEEDLLLSDNESHTPPPVNRPKVDISVKSVKELVSSKSSKTDDKSKSTQRSLTPPRPAPSQKRSQASDIKTSSDLRTKLARTTHSSSTAESRSQPAAPQSKQPSQQPNPVMREKKKIVYDIVENKDAKKSEIEGKGDSTKESGNKWRSTFSEQKLEKSAPIAARAISAALGRDTAPKRTVIASSQQKRGAAQPVKHDLEQIDSNKNASSFGGGGGRRVLVGKNTETTSNRTVVLPKKQQQPVVIVEKDDYDDDDEPKVKRGKDQKVLTVVISGLPPGMTDIRLLSLCGPEVEQVSLSTTEKDTATARFSSADACDRFVRRFNGRIVAASTLKVKKIN